MKNERHEMHSVHIFISPLLGIVVKTELDCFESEVDCFETVVSIHACIFFKLSMGCFVGYSTDISIS